MKEIYMYWTVQFQKKMERLTVLFGCLNLMLITVSCRLHLVQRYANARYLGDTENGYPIRLAWSPVGEKIAVTGYSDTENASSIYIIDASTNHIQEVLETSYGVITILGWSPTGDQIIFSSEYGTKEFEHGIWLYDLSGNSAPEYISDGDSGAFSPVENKIAVFRTVRESPVWDITLHVLDLNSKAEQLVYKTRGKFVYGISWSFDGSHLTFALAQEDDLKTISVYTLDLNSGELIQITTTEKNHSPSWSPKGDMIMYLEESAGFSTKLHIQDVSGSCAKDVPNIQNIISPVWSPDGRFIAFIGEFGGIYQLDLVDVLGDQFLTEGIVCP